MKWNKSQWYTLCLACFAEHHQDGGYCNVQPSDKFRCSLCPGVAVAEFYPKAGRRIKCSRKKN